MSNKALMTTALDLLGSIKNQLEQSFNTSHTVVSLPNSNAQISIPSSLKLKTSIFEFLTRFVEESIGKGLLLNTRDVIGAFSNYIFYSN